MDWHFPFGGWKKLSISKLFNEKQNLLTQNKKIDNNLEKKADILSKIQKIFGFQFAIKRNFILSGNCNKNERKQM